MKFSAREDIEAPIEQVFREASNFEGFERAALRRGARVQRTDRKSFPTTTLAWEIAFLFRGRQRDLLAELTELDAPNRLVVCSDSGGMDGALVVELVALSRNRTRLSAELEFRPRTLSSRLLVQTLRMAKSKLTQRYKLRVAKFAAQVEGRGRRSKSG